MFHSECFDRDIGILIDNSGFDVVRVNPVTRVVDRFQTVETDADVRVNHRRLEDAMEAGAEVIATACPYCMTMFEDAINSKGLGDEIQVMDIAEILTKK